MAKTKATKRSDRQESEALQLLKNVHSCKPLLSAKAVGIIERAAQSQDFGVNRRIGLATASKGGKWFKKLSTTVDREGAIAMLNAQQCLADHVQRLQELTKWLQTAEARLLIALAARDDYPSLKRELEQEAAA